MSDQDKKPAKPAPAKQTTTLAELVNMFIRTAGDERQPPPVRSFAAKLVLLTRFVRGALQRLAEVAVQQDALELKVAELDGSVAELAELVAGLARRAPGEGGDAADAADAADAQAASPADVTQDEDALAAKMVAEALAEVQADTAAVAAEDAAPPAAAETQASAKAPAPRPPAPRPRNGGARRGA